ncbi:hypothetical protein [Streptomyces pseudovenezuelae]|uniref:hypothetical protein n=1 Tax=Streptomyces pseudovenezuelae TaxID=67350 RepID=UPI0024750191|nr:hypothetical protein [Streptomyces pseudovenezuelae]
MNSSPYLIDESARSQDADIWFALPPGFVPLPLPDAFPENAVGQGPFAGLEPVLRMAQLLLAGGAVRCCLGLHSDDEGDGGALLSLFTLSWRATDWAPRSVLAARAAASAQDAEHIEMLDLPCGPASVVQTRLSGPPEAEIAADIQLLQTTAYVPCLDGQRIAILTLATTAVEHARHYRALLGDIVGTVSFENPLPAESDDVSDEE